MIVRSFLPPSFLITLVLDSIFGGWATPTEAAGRRALTNALVFFTFFCATLFAFVFRALGGDAVFAPVLKGIDFGPHLGEGGVIVFLTWFIILMSVNLQTSFLTPPFGFTLFYMKGTVPPSITMAHIYRGVIPFGKSVAVNIIYTSCTNECPLETARLAQLQRLLGARMGKDIFFYSISIDPEHDKPEVLKAYMEKFDVGPGWTFLTGNAADIRAVTKKLGLSRYSDSANKDGHTAILMVGDVPGGQWVRHSAVDNPEFLAASMETFFGWRDTQPRRSYAEARPLNTGGGEYLFASRCSVCHCLGQGDKMGPDLLGVTARRERTWLLRYIQVPDQVLASGDPIAKSLSEKYDKMRMPNVNLGGADAAAIVSYLEAQGVAHSHSNSMDETK